MGGYIFEVFAKTVPREAEGVTARILLQIRRDLTFLGLGANFCGITPTGKQKVQAPPANSS